MTFTVDIPSYHHEDWDEVAAFDTEAEAIAYAKERFGADDEGRICLVSEIVSEHVQHEEVEPQQPVEPQPVRDTRVRRGFFDMHRDLGRAPTAQEWMDERR